MFFNLIILGAIFRSRRLSRSDRWELFDLLNHITNGEHGEWKLRINEFPSPGHSATLSPLGGEGFSMIDKSRHKGHNWGVGGNDVPKQKRPAHLRH